MGRSYSVLVDQSGKVEDYNTATAIAYSTTQNSNLPARCIKIKKNHKKRLKRDANQVLSSTKAFHIKMFSAGIYILTQPNVSDIKEIIIDEEYDGHGDKIKGHLHNFFIEFSNKDKGEIPDLKMDLIHNYNSDENPECHELGNKVRAEKVDAHYEPNLKYLKNLILPSR